MSSSKRFNKRANGEGNTYQRKDGRWCGRYYVTEPNGVRKRRCVYANTKTEVLKKLHQAQRQIEDGKVAFQTGETLDQYHQYWLEVLTPNYLKPTTVQIYEEQFTKRILPRLGKKRLSDITPLDVQQLIAEVYRTTGSARLCHISRDALSSALKRAKRLNKIAYNPVAGVEVPQYKPKEKELWEPEELGRFLTYAREHDKRLYPLYLIMATYGLRSGEGLGIRYSDVELTGYNEKDDFGIIHIKQQVVTLYGKPTISTPKTESSIRDLPITKEIYDVLEPYFRNNGIKSKTDLLFPTESGGPIAYTCLRKYFNRTAKRAGLKHITLHSLRHMAATNLRDVGVDVKTAQVILGHSDPTTTLRIYQHSNMNNKREALTKLSSFYKTVAVAS